MGLFLHACEAWKKDMFQYQLYAIQASHHPLIILHQGKCEARSTSPIPVNISLLTGGELPSVLHHGAAVFDGPLQARLQVLHILLILVENLSENTTIKVRYSNEIVNEKKHPQLLAD